MTGVPLRVLLVETVADTLPRALEELRAGGFDASALRVEDLAALRAALQREVWDVVLCEDALPRFDALSALRALQESGRHLPFIIVADGDAARAAATLNAGANDYVSTDALPRIVPAVQRGLTDAARQSTPARRGRLLVVDDEPLVGKAVSRSLSRDHDVEVVSGAREALARLQAGAPFDIVLCDLMMPDMTGMELFDAAKELGEDVAARFIFLTGGAFTKEARAFLDGTSNTVIDKPFEPKHLRALVNERLSKS